MPSILKRLRHSLRRRKSSAPRSNRRRRNKQKIEHPCSPSSILQIDEIQYHEVPNQSSQPIFFDDGISSLSIPSFADDRAGIMNDEISQLSMLPQAGERAGDVIQAINEERSVKVGPALTPTQSFSKHDKNEKHVNTFESDSSQRLISQEDDCLDEIVEEVSSDGSQIDEIQHREVPKQSSAQPVSKDNEIPQLPMLPLIEQTGDRASDVIQARDEEWSVEVGNALTSAEENQSLEEIEPSIQNNTISEVPTKCMDNREIASLGSLRSQDNESLLFPNDEGKVKESRKANAKEAHGKKMNKASTKSLPLGGPGVAVGLNEINELKNALSFLRTEGDDEKQISISQGIEVKADVETSSDSSTAEENHSVEALGPSTRYNRMSEVPAKCMDIIGRRVKVRDTLSDTRKRGKIGYIIAWKNSITVTIKCENGDSFGVRVTSIELAGNSDWQPQLQSAMTQHPTQTTTTTIVRQGPVSTSEIDLSSAYPFRSPTEVPAKCPSIIGMKVKVRESLNDSTKRGKIGLIIEWKTRNTVSLKCEDGQTFGVRLSSISFLKQPTHPNTLELPSNEMKHQTAHTVQDDTSLNRCPESLQSVNSHPISETIVTAGVNSVNPSDEHSTMVLESNPATLSHNKDDEEVLGKVVISTEILTQPPFTNETSSPDESVQISLYKAPIEVPARDGFIIGKRVKVKDSLHDSKKRGKIGNVVRWITKSTVEVVRDDGVKFGVQLKSILFVHGNEPRDTSHTSPKSVSINRPPGRTTRSCSKRNSVAAKPKAQPRREQRTQRKSQKVDEVPGSDIGNGWIAPQNSEVVPKFGGFHIEKLVLRNDEKGETTFLNHVLKQRKLVVEVPLSSSSDTELIKKQVEDESGNAHELVSCKTYTESTFSKFMQRKFAKVIYAQTQGPELEPFTVDDYLLRFGDFSTIPPRKIAARLELFQSPSSMPLVFSEDSWFKEIPDHGYVGGGFIHEDTLFELLTKTKSMGGSAARRVAAIQVRIFIPSMGIFKGMLVKKRIRDGAPIELPCSMQKVLQSSHPQRFEGSCILICRNKVHPAPGSANEYIGRKLLPNDRKSPPEKAFLEKIKKPLSQMIFRLWETMGVPKGLCETYETESRNLARRNHAWLVGVPDPTGCLPPDTVFVPGMKDLGPHDLFVTRCPCYAREHGRKFHSFTEKPPAISSDDWAWLNNNVMFGVIIFSNPRPGMMSIPERIANGDLDGDLYLVCWDKEIVDCMMALPLVDQPAEDDGKLSTVPSNPNWFIEAQDVMIDNLKFEIGNLIGSLYKLAEKIADKSEKKLDDPDALALFEAYNEALEYQKHGRNIRLPRHLIEELTPNLRPHVEPLD